MWFCRIITFYQSPRPINAAIIHQGDPPNGIYFLAQGLVRIEIELPGGELIRLRTMGEGTIVGELGLYLNRPANANVITALPSEVYFLSGKALLEQPFVKDDKKKVKDVLGTAKVTAFARFAVGADE